MKNFFKELLKDRNGRYSFQKVVVVVLILVMLVSWVGQQFFGKDIPADMFRAIASLLERLTGPGIE